MALTPLSELAFKAWSRLGTRRYCLVGNHWLGAVENLRANGRGESADFGVIVLHSAVVILQRDADAVFLTFKLALQHLVVGDALELGIGLGIGEQSPEPGERAGKLVLRRLELGFEPVSNPERELEQAETDRQLRRQSVFDDVYRKLRVRETPKAVAAAREWFDSLPNVELQRDMAALMESSRSWSAGAPDRPMRRQSSAVVAGDAGRVLHVENRIALRAALHALIHGRQKAVQPIGIAGRRKDAGGARHADHSDRRRQPLHDRIPVRLHEVPGLLPPLWFVAPNEQSAHVAGVEGVRHGNEAAFQRVLDRLARGDAETWQGSRRALSAPRWQAAAASRARRESRRSVRPPWCASPATHETRGRDMMSRQLKPAFYESPTWQYTMRAPKRRLST